MSAGILEVRSSNKAITELCEFVMCMDRGRQSPYWAGGRWRCVLAVEFLQSGQPLVSARSTSPQASLILSERAAGGGDPRGPLGCSSACPGQNGRENDWRRETKVASSQHLIGWRPCFSYATTAMASLATVALQLWPKKDASQISPSIFSLLKKKIKWQFSTCRSKMNCGNRWMGFTIRPYRVIRSTLDACFLWTQKRVKLWRKIVETEADMWLVYNKRIFQPQQILISC